MAKRVKARPVALDDLEAVRKAFEGSSVAAGAKRGELFCPTCGDFRSMDAHLVYEPPQAGKSRDFRERMERLGSVSSGGGPRPMGPPTRYPAAPAILGYTCRQCSLRFTAFVYSTDSGDDLLVIPGRAGGMQTQHTPESVAFYLDQASRAESSGARSAAVTMYRGALDQLLFGQGYKTGMLAGKLAQLEADIAAGSAPKWARDLETDFLAVLKDLGNGAIHPNDGDISKQALLDSELLAQVKQVFLHLLDLVYEAPLRKKAALETLRKTALSIKR